MRIEGKIVDLHNKSIFEGSIELLDGVINSVNQHPTTSQKYIMPGFIDAHVHIESSMLTPANFGRMAVKHGTVAIVTDPHEIANVLGIEGLKFMGESLEHSPLKTFPSIPSSIPATPFDVAGGVISAYDVERLAKTGRFVALSEVMNVPGVLFEDEEVMAKLEIAKRYNLVIDGHAPSLVGDDLTKYIGSGITTDHECVTLEEAKEKISKGMKILIREGSAAKNYDTFKELITTDPDDVMFCTDDSHSDDILALGHINKIVRLAIKDGLPLFNILQIASLNPITHYKLDVGTLRVGDKADFIIVNDLENFDVEALYINGEQRYNRAIPIEPMTKERTINNFNHDPIKIEELSKRVDGAIKIIGLIEDEIVTKLDSYTPKAPTENLESDTEEDLAKIVYINRYTNGAPQVAFCRGFGFKRGAIASSVAHDSHNIVAVGCSDEELTKAINLLIEHKGGLSVCDGEVCDILPLPIAGIMSNRTGEEVAADYSRLQRMVHDMGSPLEAPFMTLSFLSLVVIPEVKIGEKGLFSYSKFNWL
ncbi:MAG: adenine deaminase [Rikenellaceae bacterium]